MLMSFAKTLAALADGSKTVTRREGWQKLKAGDVVTPVEWSPRVGPRWFCDHCDEVGSTLRGGEADWLLRHRVCGHARRYGPPRRLPDIRIASVRRERLGDVTPREVRREGFPGMSPAEFVAFYCKPGKPDPNRFVTRIEFKRIEP